MPRHPHPVTASSARRVAYNELEYENPEGPSTIIIKVGILAPKVYTIPLLGPFQRRDLQF